MLRKLIKILSLSLIFTLSLAGADETKTEDKKDTKSSKDTESEEKNSPKTDPTQSINLGKHKFKSSASVIVPKSIKALNNLDEISVDQNPTHGTMVSLESTFFPREYFTKENSKNAWLIIEIYNMSASDTFPKTMKVKGFCEIRYEVFENRTILVFQFKSGKIPKYQILPHDNNLLISFPDVIFKNSKGQTVTHQQVFKGASSATVVTTPPAPAATTTSPVSSAPTRLTLSSKISVNLKNAPLSGVVELFEAASNYKLNNHFSLPENVSIELVDIPWIDALEVILMYNGYGMKVSSSTIHVTPEKK